MEEKEQRSKDGGMTRGDARRKEDENKLRGECGKTMRWEVW